jgi:6-phosphogluconolactonase
MQDIPRRDFLGGAAGLMAALATGGCAPMADPSTKPSVQSMPKFAYVGSYTTKERNGQGEGINVYQVDPGTGNWTHVQLLKDIVNPSFLALEPAERFLYSAHGDGDEATAFQIDAPSGRLNVLNRQPLAAKTG